MLGPSKSPASFTNSALPRSGYVLQPRVALSATLGESTLRLTSDPEGVAEDRWIPELLRSSASGDKMDFHPGWPKAQPWAIGDIPFGDSEICESPGIYCFALHSAFPSPSIHCL